MKVKILKMVVEPRDFNTHYVVRMFVTDIGKNRFSGYLYVPFGTKEGAEYGLEVLQKENAETTNSND